MAHVKFLASDTMRGRALGRRSWRSGHLYRQTVQIRGPAAGDGKSYLQAFPVTTKRQTGHEQPLRIHHERKDHHTQIRRRIHSFNFSSRAKVSGSVVFVGYGITAREYNYDDYAGVDVKDKLALVLRHEPQEFDEKSVFSGKVYTEHSQFSAKW